MGDTRVQKIISETLEEWKTFWAPAAPVPTADAELQDDGNGPTEAADAAPAPPTREQLLEKAAEEELKTFVGAIIYDGDDAAALLNMLQSQVGLKAPLPQDGRMVLHWDAAKELEASEAYTKSHNVFSRRPGIRKQQASFIRKIADGIFTDVPLHVLLCFDGGSHACANEITRHKGFEWSKLEMMPIAESLTQRETYCWAAGGMKRRKTSVAGVSALSRLAGRETALMGVKKDTPAPKAMPFKWIDASVQRSWVDANSITKSTGAFRSDPFGEAAGKNTGPMNFMAWSSAMDMTNQKDKDMVGKHDNGASASVVEDLQDGAMVPLSFFEREVAVAKELLNQTSCARLIDCSPSGTDMCFAAMDLKIYTCVVCKSAQHFDIVQKALKHKLITAMNDSLNSRFFLSNARLGLGGEGDGAGGGTTNGTTTGGTRAGTTTGGTNVDNDGMIEDEPAPPNSPSEDDGSSSE
ncbi:unnamed protein product [Cladocopium goreaui]|uniref:Uncharacterized protein n=1 Tax=Cladocopium goreaui TaxID=2562237 RepID=A0A9P1DS36_9DINO|nr:unnamed protein product [Cladocopium goreaui]